MSSDVETVLARYQNLAASQSLPTRTAAAGHQRGKGQFKIKVCKGRTPWFGVHDQADVEKFINGQVPGYPEKRASRLRCPLLSEIGRRYCYITMDVRQLRATASPTRPPCQDSSLVDPPRLSHPYIVEMAVSQASSTALRYVHRSLTASWWPRNGQVYGH